MIEKRLFFLQIIIYCFLACNAKFKSITYPGIGTFTTNDFYDKKWRPFVELPESPEKVNPNYELYNRKLQYNPKFLKFNDTRLIKISQFNPKLQTKIMVHGFLDGPLVNSWMYPMKDKYLEQHDYNIILVDWSSTDFFSYRQAVANTRIVGALTGILIENLVKEFNVSLSSFHLLGHSLGAHVVGYAGKWLNGQIAHITGFDPAGPYYEGLTNPAARLWHTDAQFVESIHTDAHHLLPSFGFGMFEKCSHVDIFPNGGVTQPGCDQQRYTSIVTDGLIHGITNLVACNHERATVFYLEAIGDVESYPVAYQCDSYQDFHNGKCDDCGDDQSKCTILGPKTLDYKKFIQDKNVPVGKRFFMKTGPKKNYFHFQYLIRIKTQFGRDEPSHGKITLKFLDFDNNENDETIHFDDDYRTYKPGETYSNVILSHMKPSKIDRLQFSWKKGFHELFRHHQMYIDSIEILPLSTDSSTIQKQRPMKFETDFDDDGIHDGKQVIFNKK